MLKNLHINIFRKSSKTYFYSSLFFPKEIRDDIFIMYAFVRTADDLVDTLPQNAKAFKKFVKDYEKALINKSSDNPIIDSFIELVNRRRINKSWIESFLKAMESDLHKTNFQTIKQTAKYIYGSAEVIGLMLAKIMNLPKKSYPYAKLLGKSMQLSNFIRDIEEDNQLGRCYFPKTELKKFNLPSLEYSDVILKKDQFDKFIQFQIKRYLRWQKQAESGFKYIPKKNRIAIKTASDMYKLTQLTISKNPMIVYKIKVKPTIPRIIFQGIKNSLIS